MYIIVIINVDTVCHEFHMEICSAHLGSGVWLACDIIVLFVIILNVSSLKNTFSPSLRQQTSSSSCLISGRDGGNFLLHAVLKFRTAVSQNPSSAVTCRAWALMSFLACYCTATVFQFRSLSVSKTAIFNLYMGTSVNVYLHIIGL
jgi:hypothetical protein